MLPGPGELGLLDGWSERDRDRLTRFLISMFLLCALATISSSLVARYPSEVLAILTSDVFGLLAGMLGLGIFCLFRITSKGLFGAWEFGLGLGLLYGVYDNAHTVNATQSVLAFLGACFLGADGLGAAFEALPSVRSDPPTTMTLEIED